MLIMVNLYSLCLCEVQNYLNKLLDIKKYKIPKTG